MRGARTAIIARIVVWGLVLAFLLMPQAFVPLLRPLAPDGGTVIYDRDSLMHLTLWHLGLVVAAIIPSAIVAVGLAVLVTRDAGAEFLPFARALGGFGQTFPPVAVLALAVPVVGFGAWPTLIALFLYGLLPILENALTGLLGVPQSVRLAADGMGMTPGQRLRRVELPVAAPLMVEGIRIATVIAVSTAAIGSTVAAPGLGEIIIAGLNADNLAFVVQGGLLTAALALIVHDAMGLVGAAVGRRAAPASATATAAA